jgi:two-component system OmpR family sensor kinase
MSRSRDSLAARMSLLAVGVAVITALLAGGIAANLIRSAGASAAQKDLASIANDSAQAIDAGELARTRLGLRTFKISSGVIGPRGAVTTANADVRDALTPAQVQRVLAGKSISERTHANGHEILVEARSTSGGGVVLVQRRSDALAGTNRAVRRLIIALLVAAAAALLLGLLVARRLARPLRRTAVAARALAAGRRDIDVTPEGPAEVAEVADALNTLTARLRESEAGQREFLLAVSHDLRTPLTAIAGYAESLADGVVAGEETQAVGATMLAEAHRLDRLVGDLLDLARLESRDLRLDVTTVDPGPFLAAAATVWKARCSAAGVPFSVETQHFPAPMRTDPSRMRQVLDGLLENALRVTPAGRPIVLAGRSDGDRVVLEVRDGGPGLREDDLAVAFQRSVLYERYRGERQVGTGLGLAIVHRLVTRLGGTVEAGHAAEGGARFTVRVPTDLNLI